MSKLSRIRDKALESGVNALVPVISKVSGTVHDLADGPVGKAVGGAVGAGAHVVSKAPVIGRFVGGHDSGTNGSGQNGSSASTQAPADPSASGSSASASSASGSSASGSVGSSATDAPARAPRKTPKGSKAPAKKTTLRKVGKTEAAPETGLAPTNAPEVASKSPGGVTPADARDLPIPGYTQLSAAKIQERLNGLTQTDLASLYRFEKANQGRAGLLKQIDKRMVQLPLPLYDSLTLPAILDDLNGLTKPELKVIRKYEARTSNRLPILDRIDELLEVPLPGE